MATQKTITPAKRKLIDHSIAIFGSAATGKESVFMARQLVQCTLPHKNPGDVPEWTRKNGRLTLSIKPGYKDDPKNKNKRVCIGYPYGTIPRLILFWMVTEAIRAKSQELELGTSISGFMEELGLSSYTGRGKRGDATRLKDQMERLFNSFISFEGDIERDGRVGTARINMAVASESMLWWNPKTPEQLSWGSRVKLGKEFYDAITAAPVPVDMRALKALKKSPLALDLYAWLTYEAFRAHKSGESRFTSWEKLHNQMGGDYAELRNFRLKANAALTKIKLVYPGLKLGKAQGGIEVLPESLTALQPRSVTIEGTAIRVEEPRPPHPFPIPLKTTTIEKFRRLYPRLDPYACQTDFDVWQAKLEPSKRAKSYDRAFMGFAAGWAVGKG